MRKSEMSHAILDKKSRDIKAKKIVSVLNANHPNLKQATVLDIGTGAGHIAYGLTSHAKRIFSVDVTDEREEKKGYSFKKVRDESLPFKDNSMDVIISNHVIEHVRDQEKHIDEMVRVLKSGGVIYLATPNKYWITDPHYRLFFVSWLPRKIARAYVRLIRDKSWDVYPVSYGKIKSYAGSRLTIKKVVIDIVKAPEAYHLDTFKQVQPVFKKVPYRVLEVLHVFIPTIIVIMVKK